MQMIPALIQGLADAAPELIGYLPELVTMISTTILDNLPLILDAGIQLLFAVLQGVVTAVPQLIGYMPQIIGSLFRALVSGVGTPIACCLGQVIVLLLIDLYETRVIFCRHRIAIPHDNLSLRNMYDGSVTSHHMIGILQDGKRDRARGKDSIGYYDGIKLFHTS